MFDRVLNTLLHLNTPFHGNATFPEVQKWNIAMKWVETFAVEFDYVLVSENQKQSPGAVLSKGVLKNSSKITGKHLWQSLFFNKVAGLRPATLLKKETLTQVFSCKFCETFINSFFYRIPSGK